jgi:hypothetical protein
MRRVLKRESLPGVVKAASQGLEAMSHLFRRKYLHADKRRACVVRERTLY